MTSFFVLSPSCSSSSALCVSTFLFSFSSSSIEATNLLGSSHYISHNTMDMDTSSHNWLAFSLAQQPGLYEAFSSAATGAAPPHQHGGGGVEGADEETSAAATELVALAGMGPKLEDFLGAPLVRYSDEAVYGGGSELKTVAAAASGFLRGMPAEQAALDHLQSSSAKETLAPAAAESSRKAADSFGQRTSIYRGVTRHRWTGRYEAHLWDNSCRREGQSRKGRQVYLGGYDKEDKAARAYDLAALKYWGPTTTTNFPISNYEREMEEMKNMTRQEFVASLRRKSSGFSRGASIYRGVTRHHQHGRWQARIGRVAGNKDLYLGTFSTQEEAAEAYDIAAIKFRGLNAVTNFDMSRYDVNSIVNSNLPIGGLSVKSTSKPLESPPLLPLPSSSSSSSDAMSTANLNHHGPASAAYWSSLLALHHHHQQSAASATAGFGLFPPAAPVDLPGAGWNNGVVMEQQQYASPVAYGNGFANCEGGGWIAAVAPPPSSFYQQASKLQTAIFGIE